MNKNQAQRIIKDTFENKFDKARFTRFTVELLNLKSLAVSDPGVTFNTNQVPNTYKSFINSFEKIADYRSDENKLDILAIWLKKETSIERARTMQRNFIAWYLRGNCDGEMKDAALAAFVSPDKEDWRFSLVKIDYSLGEDKKGRVKISEEFTPAKRWSFLVGSNENSHTAQSQLIEILAKDEISPTLTQLEESFNIETVTKEFFKKYRELFFWTKETIDEIFTKDSKIRSDFETKNINTVDFSKKLLGQIVFLYFLQKKGWFGVARDADWGTGPKNFLRELFKEKHGKYNNFFNDILEPLFYDALRIDRSANDDYHNKFNCKIPFLNGGLFDPINNYDWVHTDINLPDELFSNEIITKEGDKGTGILDVFDRYNFTVKEDEPLEKEVAVDPEMLGKVFENLLEVKDRKSKGTYYTPREIVHYMCQQSLINYLDTEMEEKLSKNDIEKLIKYGEQFGENNADLIDSSKDIPENIVQNAKLIDEKLADIKVCDPAVGSGAFLVGMMGEIVRTRNVLTNYVNESNRTIYNFKRDCIENSLYGVDIDPGAVEIAKLRLWLSLVVDEEDIKQIKPLPNLDYKIVRGNSLMSIEKNLFNHELFSELESLKKIFFGEINPNKKQEYKNKINSLINQITDGKKEFDFEVYFSEVFNFKGGFDVAIGNPPYGLLNKKQNKSTGHVISTEEIKKYKSMTEFKPALGGMVNVFRLFIVRSINIIKHKGFMIEIFPLAFTGDISASELRKWILNNYQIVGIEAFPERDNEKKRVFENVKMSVCILNLLKEKNDNKFFIRINRDKYISESNEMTFINKGGIALMDNTHYAIPLIKDKDFRLLKKIYLISKRLSSFAHCYTGEIDLTLGNKYITNDSKEPILIKGAIIDRYLIRKEMSQGEIKHLNSKLYLNENHGKKSTHHKTKRIVMQGITGVNEQIRLKMMIIDRDIFCANSVNYLFFKDKIFELKYYLALLNSSLLNYIFKLSSTNSNVNGYEVDSLPIITKNYNDQKPFIDLVDKIFVFTRDNDFQNNLNKQTKVREYEKQINQLVYELYSLTEEEIKIVERSH